MDNATLHVTVVESSPDPDDKAFVARVGWFARAYDYGPYKSILDGEIISAFTNKWADRYKTSAITHHVRDPMVDDITQLVGSETDEKMKSAMNSVISFLTKSDVGTTDGVLVVTIRDEVNGDVRVVHVPNMLPPLQPTRRSASLDAKSDMRCAVAVAFKSFLENAAFNNDDKLEFTMCSSDTLKMYDKVTDGKPNPGIVRRITDQLNAITSRRKRVESDIENRMKKKRKHGRCAVCLDQKQLVVCPTSGGKHTIACVQCTQEIMARGNGCPQCKGSLDIVDNSDSESD
jgi:hypothetical protein